MIHSAILALAPHCLIRQNRDLLFFYNERHLARENRLLPGASIVRRCGNYAFKAQSSTRANFAFALPVFRFALQTEAMSIPI
jgi:hypothetical protein